MASKHGILARREGRFFVTLLFWSLTMTSSIAAMEPRTRYSQILDSLSTPPESNYSETDAPSPESSGPSSTFPPSAIAAGDEGSTFSPFAEDANISLVVESAAPSAYVESRYPSTPLTASLPSNEPSLFVSPSPSMEPTLRASATPSAFPSSSPTIFCHDHSSYRSPINNLTCEDHTGTNCVHWRILGLNTTELKELIEKCPETCQIPCGGFVQFSVSLGFTISKVPGLMDASTKNDLELVTRQHLLAFIRTKVDRKIAFEFDRVELVSQAIVEEAITDRHSHTRRAQVNSGIATSSLNVRMEFEGFTVGISNRDASKLLIEGIDSATFTVALQGADAFFAKSVISSAAEQETPTLLDKERKKGASPAIVVLSTLFAILFLVSGVCFCIYQNRSGKWLPKIRFFSPYEIDDDFETHSPLRHGTLGAFAMSSLPSPLNIFSLDQAGSMLSFDDSRASTQQAGNSTSLLRLIASLSLGRSKSSSEVDSSTHLASQSPTDETLLVSGGTSPELSHLSDEVVREHPLSRIIPPMIVFDHIDDENSDSSPVKKRTSVKSKDPQVPAKRIQASEGLLCALRGGQRSGNQGILFTGSSHLGPDSALQGPWQYPEDKRPLSPFGLIMDSDSDDDASVASTPVRSEAQTEVLPLRRSLSSSALDERLESSSDPVSIFSSDPTSIGRHADMTSRYKMERKDYRSILFMGAGKGVMRGKSTSAPSHPVKRTISADSEDVVNTCHTQASTPERPVTSQQTSPTSAGWLKHQTRGRSHSPLPKAKKDQTLKPKGTFSKIVDFGAFKKLHHVPAPWERNGNEADSIGMITPSLGTDHSLDGHDEMPTRYEFEAPRKGQLGLVIESDPFTGLVVHAVKDYSPLLGLVQQGDKIVEVDGKNTTRYTLRDMAKLLSTKPSLLSGSHTNLKITVMRSPPRELRLSPPLVHIRATSYGSSSVASTSRFGTASSFDDAGCLPYTAPHPARTVHFSDGLYQGSILSNHKPQASF